MATNLKARTKPNPSRIQSNLSSSQAIVEQQVINNNLLHLAESEALSIDKLPNGDISVPLTFWLEHKTALIARSDLVAVQVGSDQDPAELVDDLDRIDVIVLPFVAHVDGRGYSHAQKLRLRYHYKGQIRAIGDVKFDQLGFLTRVGVNAFELPETENYQTALRAFSEFSDVYQPSADKARLVFSRRRAVH